jgi:integrase
MARREKGLTPFGVAALAREGYWRDHGEGAARGLYVQVAHREKAGTRSIEHGVTRSWVYRYTSPVTKRIRWMGLGSCEVIGLAEARELANAARRLVTLGADPIEHRRSIAQAERNAVLKEAASHMTFRQCVEGYLAVRLAHYRNEKHKAQWRSTLERANHVFGDLPVGEIDTPILVKFLEPIWRKTPETGSRLRGRVERVLDWAAVRKFRQGDNPARWKGHLEHVLGGKPKSGHHAAMPFDQVPNFMARLRNSNSISARALEFLILTVARTGEAINAKWTEIDLKARRWTVPADRMKAGRDHTVPLSDRSIEILENLPRVGDYVFPGAVHSKPLSNMALLQLLRGLDDNGYSVHGFRSTFRDWAGERTNFEREVVEHALAHKLPDKVEAAYRRGTAVEKRARLMQAWANFCDAETGDWAAAITSIRAR